MKRAALTAAALMSLFAPAEAQTPTGAARSGYAEANGVRYYYALHGPSESAEPPILLLHGGMMNSELWGPVLPAFAAQRQVLAVDLLGHGRTALGARTRIDLMDIGDDLALVLDRLGYERVDVFGYSMGGGAAFRLAVQHPERVRRLVLLSAGYSTEGFYPELRAMQAQVGAAIAESLRPTPMYQSYARIAPDPGEFPRLLDLMGEMMRRDYDWSADVRALSMPTMIVFGDSDMYPPSHVARMYELLGGGQRDAGWMREHMATNRLAILPNATHYDIVESPLLVPAVLPFLNGATGGPGTSAQP